MSDITAHAQCAVTQAREYVERAIASYAGDPPDNQFQKGFLAALEVVRDEAFAAQPPAAPVAPERGWLKPALDKAEQAAN